MYIISKQICNDTLHEWTFYPDVCYTIAYFNYTCRLSDIIDAELCFWKNFGGRVRVFYNNQ